MQNLTWQPLTIHDPFPYDSAVQAGNDCDGTTIYVGRAFHEGDQIPAKLMPQKSAAYVSYGGVEIAKQNFEVLLQPRFAWEHSSHGSVPSGAVPVGRTSNGEPLYMGRCFHEGSQTPGKVHCSHGCLYFPFGGVEHSTEQYEVLVKK